jgi:hypothetical protein
VPAPARSSRQRSPPSVAGRRAPTRRVGGGPAARAGARGHDAARRAHRRADQPPGRPSGSPPARGLRSGWVRHVVRQLTCRSAVWLRPVAHPDRPTARPVPRARGSPAQVTRRWRWTSWDSWSESPSCRGSAKRRAAPPGRPRPSQPAQRASSRSPYLREVSRGTRLTAKEEEVLACQLPLPVDPPGDHAGGCRPRAHHPPADPRRRATGQAGRGEPAPGADPRARALAGGAGGGPPHVAVSEVNTLGGAAQVLTSLDQRPASGATDGGATLADLVGTGGRPLAVHTGGRHRARRATQRSAGGTLAAQPAAARRGRAALRDRGWTGAQPGGGGPPAGLLSRARARSRRRPRRSCAASARPPYSGKPGDV